MNRPDPIIIETSETPNAAVIWLHGLGADGNDFVPIIAQLGLPQEMAIRFIFPNAPIIPITLNQGYQMPGWYDITSAEIADRGEDSKGIASSSEYIQQLIDAEREQGISIDRIIIAGFSQGGAIALHVGLNYRDLLAGVMALSTYLPDCAHAKKAQHTDLNIFMAHGTQDSVVQYKYGKMSLSTLQQQGYAVKWHEYPMGHSVCAEQIKDISRWLQQSLS